MDIKSTTPKFRSKSSIKIGNKTPIRKNELGDFFDKEQTKVQSYMRVYGHIPTVRRFRSTRDSKPLASPAVLPSTPSNKNQNTSYISLTKPNRIRYHEKIGESETLNYEILKAQSDKLELERDLSTYEFELLGSINFANTLKEMKGYSYSIVNMFSDYERHCDEITNLLQDINSNKKILYENSLQRESSLAQIEDFENFNIKVSNKLTLIEEYKGISTISGKKCLINIKSKLYESHHIKCLLPSGEYLQLNINKNLTEQVHKLGSYKKMIELYICPHLYIMKICDDINLFYDENYGVTFLAFLMKLKGAKNFATIIVRNLEDSYKIEIGGSNAFKIVDKFSLRVNNNFGGNANKIRLEIQKSLIFRYNSLLWGDNPFNTRENSSKFLKESFLSDAFNDYIRKIFSLKISFQGKIFRIEGFECQKIKQVKFSSSKSTVSVGEDSKEFRLLFTLQCIDYYKNHKTLSKSLEMEYLLNSIFK